MVIVRSRRGCTKAATLDEHQLRNFASLVAIPVSIKLITAVFRHGALDPFQMVVLLALADWSDENGKSWPSIPVLAKKCHMTERQVQRCLQELRKQGLIKVDYKVGRGRSNDYYLNIKALLNGEPCSPFKDFANKEYTSDTSVYTSGENGECQSPFRECGIPGCEKPARVGERYCSETCKEFGDFLERKYGNGK